MQYEEVSWYSERVNRWMRIKVYGHYGVPVICYPCQGKQSDDFYNNGMIDNLADYIDQGKIKLYCLDSNDDETVDYQGWDKGHASYMLSQYHEYVVNEVLPFIYDRQGGYCEPFLFGCSMGATHAANHFFRRPDLFSGFLGLSGNYDNKYFFPDYFDENAYNNSPVHYLDNMPSDHPWIEKYNQKTMVIVIGKGAYEYLVDYSNYWLKEVTDRKGIHIWYNFWDESATHDWPSWKYQARYFMDLLLEE
ncbi:MAG: esterase [Erysipelotrichaceae bacterium]|nr:esterase [Erysipelotrichaceae bacterium]